jgi:hypothetical protein
VRSNLIASSPNSVFTALSGTSHGFSTNLPLKLVCTNPIILSGQADDHGVATVYVDYNRGQRSWAIKHTLKNGVTVYRELQYALQDTSDSEKTEWSGYLNKNQDIRMVGTIRKLANANTGEFSYFETLFNGRTHEKVEIGAQCTNTIVESNNPSETPHPAPAPEAKPGHDSVPIFTDGRTVYIDVVLGGYPTRMVLDTGATHSVVSYSLGIAGFLPTSSRFVGVCASSISLSLPAKVLEDLAGSIL